MKSIDFEKILPAGEVRLLVACYHTQLSQGNEAGIFGFPANAGELPRFVEFGLRPRHLQGGA